MPENDCPINGVNCVSIARVEALERALEAQKQHSSLAREKSMTGWVSWNVVWPLLLHSTAISSTGCPQCRQT